MTRDEAIANGSKLNQHTLPTLKAFNEQFATEDACRHHFFTIRWPDGVVTCPRCGRSERVKKINQPWRWQCRSCDKNGYRFSLTTKTIFENTKYPLRVWFQVMYLMLQSKKGMSALQIHRTIGSGDYRTAWYICQRVRAAFQSDEILKLGGEVEVDETFIGGKDANRHRNKKQGHRNFGGKVPVIGAISRKGNVVCKVIENIDTETLSGFVNDAVSNKVSLVATDEASGYEAIEEPGWVPGRPALPHKTVTHSRGEYVRGEVHTANLDSFWALLKRGIMGSYHKVSKKYLPLYVNEFAFRHNHRKDPQVFDHVLSAC